MVHNPLPEDPAVLVLADGTVFQGKAAGSRGTSFGEIAFNTGMYGYQEIFTDPSYHRQIVVMATAHIGNYGVHEEETESSGPRVAGVVVRNFSSIASRPGGNGTLQDDLEGHEVVGIRDVDTRALVTHIRENGAMNAVVSSDGTSVDELKAKLAEVPSMEGMELSSQVSVSEPREAGEGRGASRGDARLGCEGEHCALPGEPWLSRQGVSMGQQSVGPPRLESRRHHVEQWTG